LRLINCKAKKYKSLKHVSVCATKQPDFKDGAAISQTLSACKKNQKTPDEKINELQIKKLKAFNLHEKIRDHR
jgi:hypothetical protein